jgi:hypothetical protein
MSTWHFLTTLTEALSMLFPSGAQFPEVQAKWFPKNRDIEESTY